MKRAGRQVGHFVQSGQGGHILAKTNIEIV